MKILTIALTVSAMIFAGCKATTYPYSQTSEKQFAPKSSESKLKVYSSLPAGSYEEIGVFNIDWGDDKRPTTPSKLLEKIEAVALAEGGDFVVADINGYGVYIRATLYRYK